MIVLTDRPPDWEEHGADRLSAVSLRPRPVAESAKSAQHQTHHRESLLADHLLRAICVSAIHTEFQGSLQAAGSDIRLPVSHRWFFQINPLVVCRMLSLDTHFIADVYGAW